MHSLSTIKRMNETEAERNAYKARVADVGRSQALKERATGTLPKLKESLDIPV
jgi:hypothetical protein